MKSNKVLILIITLFIGISGIVYSSTHGKPVSSDTIEEKAFESIKVDVSGAVASPGVYALSFDSRVGDAVEAAGGFARDADPDFINKADFLKDGQFLYIPHKDESLDEIYLKMNENPDLNENPDYVININEDGVYKLTLLPGIGEKTAQSIVAYRDEHGGFSTVEELLEVPGIGETTLEKIRNYITLG